MTTESSTSSLTISLNTDIGEGYGAWRIADDETLLGLVTDANLACGFHASDPDIMRATCAAAARNGVGIGAQVGFHDILGFGRRFIEIPRETLSNDVLYQLGATEAFGRVEGAPLSYVKVHGALYHSAVKYPEYAAAVTDAVSAYDARLPVMCQPATTFHAAVVAAGLKPIAEGYIDRAYTQDGLLVPRGLDGAMITDPLVAAARAVQLAVDARITTIDGVAIDMPVESVCIHSDSAGAVELANAVRSALTDAGVTLKSVTR